MQIQIQLHSTPIFLLPLFGLVLAGAFHPSSSEEARVPNFAFSWLNDNNTFQAGDITTIKIKVLGEFNSKGNASHDRSAFSPLLTVNGKVGNSSFISGVTLDTAGDTESWRILFTPIRVGVFNVFINDDPFKVFDSSLHFEVVPGKIYQSVCIASWMDLLNEYEAGAKATVLIVPRDAFGNNVSSTGEDLVPYNFTVFAHYSNGSLASVPNISDIGWSENGFITIEFIAAQAGSFLLDVVGGNQTLNGSPLPFKVHPGGHLDVSNSVAKLKFDTQFWQIFSMMEIYIHQRDPYGNLVPGFYEFDADVIERETNLSIPIADLHFEEVVPGIQLFSFALLEPGNFLLTISDSTHNGNLSNMPLAYTVFTGYCDGSASIVNGSGLNDSVAGETAQFALYLNDIFQYPSFVEGETIQVRILREIDSYNVQSNIYPLINGSEPGQIGIAPAPSNNLSNAPIGDSRFLADAFRVIYTPEKTGIYEIYVLCGNVLLNGGHSFRKEVLSGEVDVSLSRVVTFSTKVSKLVENEIRVQLMDSFSNPVLSQQSRLLLAIASGNSSAISAGTFVNNNDGSYTSHYLMKEVGTFEMSVSYDGKHLSSCPFVVNVYSEEYFPGAFDDKVSVWEDESIAFDVLANDYFAGDNASIVEFLKPNRGSLLRYGRLFRYTPYQDYYGNDSFVYTISDVNGNLASASVNITVLNIPPQIIAFPSQLQATEDVTSPRYGGFSGLQIRYSEPMENISVSLSAQSGSMLLSPMPMHFWKPRWEGFAVKKGANEAKDLVMEGSVEVLNVALQSIQYLGKENFAGQDSVRVSASNTNGKNDVEIAVSIEAINDPPFINVPKFIILKKNGHESLLFDKAVDKFEFCIGDPDLVTFPGLESHFILSFLVEVDDGFLVTSLPSELISTTELKLMSSNQWQPLQTYVTISKHFMVKANGIRFRGTINDCNSVMQQLSYHGREQGAVLTVKVNDMGHYGCYSDCAERISMPLYAEATVNLIRRKPLSSLAAHTLGSVIIVEFLVVLPLGVLLLFFTCKCAILLVNERRSRNVQNSEPSSSQALKAKGSNSGSPEKTTKFTGCCSSPFLLCGQASNFRQRSSRKSRAEESGGKEMLNNPFCSSSRDLPSFVPLSIEKELSEAV